MSEVVPLVRKLQGIFPKSPTFTNDEAVKPDITNVVFRLHSDLTFVLLVLCSTLVFVQQLLGNHIKCLLPSEELRASAVTTYCFITGTYTVPNLKPGLFSHPGVGQHIKGQNEQKFHHYFQWVPFVLFLQALLFRVPHLLWKSWERNGIASFIYRATENVEKASKDFVRRLKYNQRYFFSFQFAEIMNLGLAIGTFFITDWFLKGEFTKYGINYFRYLGNYVEENPADKIFPKVSKCDFQKFGPSGEIVKYDIVCILALNVINEKIFLGLWFWLIFLSCLGTASLIYRLILLTISAERLRRINHLNLDHETIKTIVRKISFTDWFFLKGVSENLDSSIFENLCKYIVFDLKRKNETKSTFSPEIIIHQNKESSEDTENPGLKYRKSNSNSLQTQTSLYNLDKIEEEKENLINMN